MTGTFLPVLVFVIVAMLILQPLLPPISTIAATLSTLDKEWTAIMVTFLTVLLTGLLYNLNIPIIRLYEGYPWQDSYAGQKMIARCTRQFKELSDTRSELRVARVALQQTDGASPMIHKLQREQDRIARTLMTNFPREETLILPTRLGNSTRSFEDYSRQQYGLDAIFLWPRIVAVASKDYLSSVDDAKSSFDFFLNCSVLSSLLATLVLVTGLASKKPFATDAMLIMWLCELALLSASAYMCYLGAINRAVAWGAQVKGVFDLYRWDLLKQLGYTQKPTDRNAERELWTEISQQIFYGDPLQGKPWPYTETRKILSGSPPDVELQLLSGTTDLVFRRAVKVHYRITNIDSQARTVSDLVLTAEMPAGWTLKWNSARLVSDDTLRGFRLVGSNPARFAIGGLGYGEELEFECVFNLTRTS